MKKHISLVFAIMMLVFSMCPVLTVSAEDTEMSETQQAVFEALNEQLMELTEKGQDTTEKAAVLHLKLMLNNIKINEMSSATIEKEQAVGILKAIDSTKYADFVKEIENNYSAIKAETGDKLSAGSYTNLQKTTANISAIAGMDADEVSNKDGVKIILIITLAAAIIFMLLKFVIIKK